MSNERLQCIECQQPFTWNTAEQRYFKARGLSAPKRCPGCRERRKNARASAAAGRATQPRLATPARHTLAKPRSAQRLGARIDTPWLRATLIVIALVLIVLLILWEFKLMALGILSLLIAINLVTLVTYRYDKTISGVLARSQSPVRARVPEIVLLGLALVGGSPAAALAMWGFRQRHKTSKPAFLLWFRAIVIGQIALLLVAAFVYARSSGR